MPLPLPDRLRPGTIFAHRGNRVAERENTVAAFRSAADAGAAGVELDVRLTMDGSLVVHHDAAVDGVGSIGELTSVQLADRAPWVPSLSEAIEACGDMWVNVEVKVDAPRDREAVDVLVSSFDATGVLVSSFDWETAFRAAAVGWAAAYLVDTDLTTAIDRGADMRAVNPRGDLVAGPAVDDYVARARAAGLWLMVWTVNDATEARRLRDAGVDAIFTDDPQRMVAELA